MTASEIEILKLAQSQLITAETRLYEHIATVFRWLMATLFAANGGALLALFGSERMMDRASNATLGFFAFGLVLSILMGILSTFWGHLALVRISTTRLMVDQSLIGGVINDQIVPRMLAEKPTWITWFPSYAGFLSFVCFAIGMLTVACGR